MRVDEVPSPCLIIVARRAEDSGLRLCPSLSRVPEQAFYVFESSMYLHNKQAKQTRALPPIVPPSQPAPVRLGLICREGVMGRGHRAGKHGSGLGTFNAR